MGLDELLQIKVRNAYPDNFGRINCFKGLQLASEQPKEPIFYSWFAVDKIKPRTHALEVFANLAHVLRMLMRKDMPERVDGIRKYVKTHLPNDLDFYMLAIDAFENCRHVLDSFFSMEAPKEFVDLFDGFYGRKLKQRVQEWERKVDRFAYTFAIKFADDLEHVLFEKREEFKEGRERRARLRLDSKMSELIFELNGELRKLESGSPGPYEAYLHDALGLEKYEGTPSAPDNLATLIAHMNYNYEDAIINKVNCCITGPDGKSRDASIIYCLDSAVHFGLFSASSKLEAVPEVFGMAIFVKAKGHHYSKPGDPEDYLVLEGFPANHEYYGKIGKLLCCGPYVEGQLEPLTLPQLVYRIALETASQMHIPKIFININHPDRQESVADVICEAAQSIGLQKSDIWKFDKQRFKLLKDQNTLGPLQKIAFGEQFFEYTHFLEKTPLSPEIVNEVRRGDAWNGEGFFDTWYDWNKFIMETHPQWSDELKSKHPYAKAIYDRGKDPQWNLGIGYCKGFEVDVEKECKRLGIN